MAAPSICDFEFQELPPTPSDSPIGETVGAPGAPLRTVSEDWILPMEQAIPQPLKFAPTIDARLKITSPFLVSVSHAGEQVVAYAEGIEEFGCGGDIDEALQDLGKTITELFFSLEERAGDLGPGLQQLRESLDGHLMRVAVAG